MDNTNLMVKERAQVNDNAGEASSVLAGQAVSTVAVVSGLIGIWAVSCMVSAIVSSGPIGLFSGWISSVM